MARWSEGPAPGAEDPRAEEQAVAARERASVEAMLDRRAQANLVAAFGDARAVEEAAALRQQAQEAEAEAAAAMARAAKLRAAADDAMAALQAEAESAQMREAMAAWEDAMVPPQRGEEEDLRAAMRAAMERSGDDYVD